MKALFAKEDVPSSIRNESAHGIHTCNENIVFKTILFDSAGSRIPRAPPAEGKDTLVLSEIWNQGDASIKITGYSGNCTITLGGNDNGRGIAETIIEVES